MTVSHRTLILTVCVVKVRNDSGYQALTQTDLSTAE